MAKFSVPLSLIAEKAAKDVENITRKITIDMFSRVINKSPVGNPELWAANAEAVYARETYNLFGALLGKKAASARTVNKKIKLPVGKGYVGGRFKGNWNVSLGSPDLTTTEAVDPSGQKTLGRMVAAVEALPTGNVIWLTNALPYAQRLENGWSKQAPLGMIRTTLAEFASGPMGGSVEL